MTTGEDQLNGWTKKLQNTSQRQTYTKKGSWSLFDGLLPVWSTTTFWILVKPLHLWSMFSKLMRYKKTAMPEAKTGQQKWPNSSPQQCLIAHCITNAQKLNKLGYKVLLHPPYLLDLSPTDYYSSSILTTFCRENAFTTSQRQKILSKSSSNPEAQIFMLWE